MLNFNRSIGSHSKIILRNVSTHLRELNHIKYEAPNEHASQPVIILHGLLGNAKNFQSWAAKLSNQLVKPRTIYALDMRNHGSSFHDPDMSYPEMANDILNFMKCNGMDKAVLLGHSMGGKAACMTALLHPENVIGLIVMDIAPVSYSVVDQTNWGETQRIITCLHNLNLKDITSKNDADLILEKDILDPTLRAFALTNLVKDQEWKWRINIEAIYHSMSKLAQFEIPESSPLFYKGDTFFIAGGKSRYIRSSHLNQIGKRFPNHSLQTIPNVGHWIHAENPDASIKAVKMYLDREVMP